MVYCGGEKVTEATSATRAEEDAEAIEMTSTERSKVPLHNFTLPLWLKWGDRRKLSYQTQHDDSSHSDASVRVRWSNRSPSKSYVEEGIGEEREKVMMNFRTASDGKRHELFEKSQRRVSPWNDVEDESEEEHSRSRTRSPPSRFQVATENEERVKLRSLRTRKAARYAPAAGIGLEVRAVSSSNIAAGKSEGAKLPTVLKVGGDKEKEEKERVKKKREKKETTKLSVTLSKKEIDEDFMKMVGHLPPRRPKKHHRAVQRTLDTLFPGLWLTEVTADMYSVPNVPDSGKR